MNIVGIYRKRSFIVCTIYALILGGGICVGGFLLAGLLPSSFPNAVERYISWYVPRALPAFQWGIVQPPAIISALVCGVVLLNAWVVWALVTTGVAPALKNAQKSFVQENYRKTSGEKDFIDQRMEQERKRRLFLHFLGVLQREGRLLDFFDEDLSLYEDEQIGAAVRSIQEDCKKTLKRYIALKPVMEAEEGDKVTIEKGFDMDAIVLTGNVVGNPPFEGIVRHPGWKAGKKEVPKLSDVQDSGILMPAQVEIL